jgi:hypothetical protein
MNHSFILHMVYLRITRCHLLFYLKFTCFQGNCYRTTKHSMLMNIRLLFIHCVILRQVRGHVQSEFSAECELVLLLSIYHIFSFPSGHPVAAYVFFFVFPSLLSFLHLPFNNVFSKSVPTQDMKNPVSLPSVYSMQDIPTTELNPV